MKFTVTPSSSASQAAGVTVCKFDAGNGGQDLQTQGWNAHPDDLPSLLEPGGIGLNEPKAPRASVMRRALLGLKAIQMSRPRWHAESRSTLLAFSNFKNSLKSGGSWIVAIHDLPEQFKRSMRS